VIYNPVWDHSPYGGFADDLFLLVLFLIIMGRILVFQGARALMALFQLLKLLLRDLQRWYSAR